MDIVEGILTGLSVFIAMIIMHRQGVLAGRRELLVARRPEKPRDDTNVIAEGCMVRVNLTYAKPLPIADARQLMTDFIDALPAFMADRMSMYVPDDPRAGPSLGTDDNKSFGKFSANCEFVVRRLYPKGK